MTSTFKQLIFSIRFRVLVMIIAPLLLIFVTMLINVRKLNEEFVADSINSSLENYSQTLNLAVSLQLANNNDISLIAPYLEEFLSEEVGGIVYLALTDNNGLIITQTSDTPEPLPTPNVAVDHGDIDGVLHISKPILLDLENVGSLRYGVSIAAITSAAEKVQQRNIEAGVVTLVVLAIGVGLLAWILLRRVNPRLSRLLHANDEIARGNLSYRLQDAEDDEIGSLARQVDLMANSIQQRISELEQSNHRNEQLNTELTEALERLKRSQKQLVQAEKLAGLGSLVAGVSHELNTPLGNARVVASTFEQKIDTFESEMATGLRKASLQSFLSDAREVAELVNKNLTRAADLITSFKGVAVDQTNVRLRSFNLYRVISDVLVTLEPSVRQKPITVKVDIPTDIEMFGLPGPLGQVITNLFNNAVLHAFDGADGTITVSAKREEDTIMLCVSDDGWGIPEHHLERLFDPFFTTKMGQGGSGLGMHIVYNLVTTTLGGSIEVRSRLNEGTVFDISLPRHLSEDRPNTEEIEIA